MVKHETLEVPASKIKRDIAEILKREGFIRDFTYARKPGLEIRFKFVITRSSFLPYFRKTRITPCLNGLGIAIISTSEGVITDKEARAKNIGGEVIAYFRSFNCNVVSVLLDFNTSRKNNNFITNTAHLETLYIRGCNY
jgi:small subunit ribosomal protein S8